MNTVERVGEAWVLVQWQDVGLLLRKGTVLASLKSASREDAECEARLQGWL